MHGSAIKKRPLSIARDPIPPSRPGGPIRRRLAAWCRAAFLLDLRSLAVFRIAIGCILCCDALLRTRDFRLMFAPDGLFPIDVLRRYQGDPSVWSLCFLSESLGWQGVVLAIEGLAGLALAAGLFTRTACLVAWAAALSIVRRTAPAANAGDMWLATLLFWGMFLPLGRVWSLDARRAGRSGGGSAWGVPLVLQIAAVYLAAGASKWNASWLSGEAVSHALSVHDHGTPLGEWLAGATPLAPILSWLVLSLELLGPILLLTIPLARVRMTLVTAFLAFHAGVACLMTVGLFAPIGAAAWLAVVPGTAWDRARVPPAAAGVVVPATAVRAQRFFVAVAAVIWLAATVFCRAQPLPYPLAAVANLTSLSQQWSMFGDVPGQRQWVYGPAELADGRMVDLLRDGRPLEPAVAAFERPEGGFASLRHHRWHKLFWELPRPPMRVFSPSIAAALARDWNARHGPTEQVRSLEIRFARLPTGGSDATFHELLLATWPDRESRDGGNLERFLRESESD